MTNLLLTLPEKQGVSPSPQIAETGETESQFYLISFFPSHRAWQIPQQQPLQVFFLSFFLPTPVNCWLESHQVGGWVGGWPF